MSTNLEKRNLAASCSSFPAFYESGSGIHSYDPELKREKKLKPSQSVQSLPVIDGSSPLDYRKLLLQKRNSIKKTWHISESDSDEPTSDSSCDDDDVLVIENGMAEAHPTLYNGRGKSIGSSQDVEDIDPRDISCPEKQLLTSDKHVILKIAIPEQTFTKCLRVELTETAWDVKHRIMQSLAVKLPDPLNYGLFSNDLGCFFEEQKLVSDYVNKEQVAFCELRYKTRIYHHPVNPGGESRRLCKMQGEAKRKELMRYVRQHNVEKLCKLLNKGVDPNFHTPPNGETPLTTIIANYTPGVSESVAFEYISVPLIKALVSGGAHFDFRNQRGFSPLHVAVRNGNAQAVKALLSLGAPSDSYDNSELTPLYHCSLSDSSADCIAPLCQHGATITCVNLQKWNVLHQICRHGRLAHLESILDVVSTTKGAEVLLDMQNESGNTALHICAIYNQQQCLLSLLNAGIDKDKCNYSHQDAFQVAVISRNMNIANLIQDFPKLTEQEISMLMHEEEAEAIKPPSGKDRSVMRRHTFSSAFLTSTNKGNRLLKKRGKLNAVALSGSDIEVVENTLTPGRIVEPSPLKMGSTISSDIRKQGPVITGPRKVEQPSPIKSDGPPYSTASENVYEMAADSTPALETNQTSFTTRRPGTEKEQSNISTAKSDSNVKKTDDIMMSENDVSLQATSHPDVFHRYRDVVLSKGRDGYGFVLRGAKADQSIGNFSATARHPGLQYLESVEVGSNAHRVGLRSGDYILKINAVDVTCMGHRQTVDVIRKLRDPLRMRVVTVVTQPNEYDTDESSDSSVTSPIMTSSSRRQPLSPGQEPHRTASVRSAVGKLDSVLALEDGFDTESDTTASLRRRPLSRKLRSQDVEKLFRFEETFRRRCDSDVQTQPDKRDLRKTISCVDHQPVRVLPPSVPSKSAPNAESPRADPGYPPQTDFQFSPAHHPNAGFTSNHTTSGHVSTLSSIDPRKGPPLPPTRGDSRLSNLGEVPPPPQRATPSSPAVGHSFGKPYTPPSTGKVDLSGFAGDIARQAENRRQRINSKEAEKVTPITQRLVAKPPPTVAPKPGRGKSNGMVPHVASPSEEHPKSAFELALAAKHENLRKRSQSGPTIPQTIGTTNSTVGIRRNMDTVDSPKPTQEELRELSQLPPPPPVPTSDPTSPLFYNLPPPPPPVTQASTNNKFEQSFLPPPPDSMLSSEPPSVPRYAAVSKPLREHQTIQSSPAKYNDRYASNGMDSGSSGDSGVYDFASQVPHHPVDNLSVVSSVSTLSSEDGSDLGVSCSYDLKPSPEKTTGNMYLNVLKKNKSPLQRNQASKAAAGVVLTTVSFHGSKAPAEPPKSNVSSFAQPIKSTPVNNHVTKTHSTETKPAEAPKIKDTVPARAVSSGASAKTKPWPDWNIDDVCKWLNDLGMGSYTQMFSENEITGNNLPDLGKEDLQELGVTRLGHRLTIEKAVKKLTGK